MKNKRNLIILILIIIVLSYSCHKDNGGNFEPSDTEIICPCDGDTLNDALTRCEWKGLDGAVEFQYRLDTEDWFNWTIDTTTEFFLDEGSHIFIVKSRNEFNREDPTPATANFFIDAISGPALWLKKRKVKLSVLQPCSLKVWVEDVNSLMIANLELSYDNSHIKIEDIHKDTSFLSENGGDIQLISEFNDTLQVAKANIGIVGGTPKGVSGSGPLITINFLLKVSDSTTIAFTSSSRLRDTLNNSIPLTGMFPCIIIPEE